MQQLEEPAGHVAGRTRTVTVAAWQERLAVHIVISSKAENKTARFSIVASPYILAVQSELLVKLAQTN